MMESGARSRNNLILRGGRAILRNCLDLRGAACYYKPFESHNYGE